ncbi:hypothetical protein CK203_007999 [Vitis vinifera]|uniref:Uncharacterized protein n=1 Tax=Vitis vinifera TaxID=29760 RepID=A0A438K176_VITVI|nr:hypothetical protein CK203_007999 [Vitis vinifera]
MSSIGTSKGILEIGKFALYVSIPIHSDVYFGKQFREYEEAHPEGILFPQSVL